MHPGSRWFLATAIAAATVALGGCETTGDTRPPTTATDSAPVSEPIPLPSAPPVEVSNLPPEISAPITPPSNAPLPVEGDVLTSGEVLDRLRARFSTPTCIVGPNNTRWRHKYAGYPQHFADEVEATLPMMLVVLDEIERRKMPGEFALVPIVESWYRPDTHSFGGAAGMWQMLDETSRNNGATVINGYDGRLSTLDSTASALTYLGKLHAMFNDWRLTAMAYNSGEYRLMRTMSPEELAQRSAGGIRYRRPNGLAGGTYEYVSKMRALTCLLAQPQRQGIPLLTSLPITHWIPYTMAADITSLDELARRLATDADDLKTFNRGYHNGHVVDDAPRTLLVPASTRPRWAAAGSPARDFASMAARPTPISTPLDASTANPMPPVASHAIIAAPAASPAIAAPLPPRATFNAPANATSSAGMRGATSTQTATSMIDVAHGVQSPAVAAKPVAGAPPSATNPFAPSRGGVTPVGTFAAPPAAMSLSPVPVSSTKSIPPMPIHPSTAPLSPPAAATSVPASTDSTARSTPTTHVDAPTGSASSPSAATPVPTSTVSSASSMPTIPVVAAASIHPTPIPSTAPSDAHTASTSPRAPIAAMPPPSGPVSARPFATDASPSAGAASPPTTTTTATEQPALPAPRTYKVVFGDNLDLIAQRFDLSADDLRAWNHLEQNAMLMVGQVLRLEP